MITMRRNRVVDGRLIRPKKHVPPKPWSKAKSQKVRDLVQEINEALRDEPAAIMLREAEAEDFVTDQVFDDAHL